MLTKFRAESATFLDVWKKLEKRATPSIAQLLLSINHLFSRFFMADPFVLKVLRVLTAVFSSVYHSLLLGTYSSNGLNSLYGLPHLLWNFPEFKQPIVASQCLLPFPIIGNLKFHWTFPRMRRATGVAVGPRVLCAQQVLLQRHGDRRSLARLHASPPRLELLDASTKAPRLVQRFCVLFQLPRDSQRFAGKKKKKKE